MNEIIGIIVASVICWLNFVIIDTYFGLPQQPGVKGVQTVGDSIEKVTDTFNNEYKMNDDNYCVLFNESQEEDPMNEQKDDSWIWINYLTENDTIVRIQIYDVKFGANLN